MTVHERRTPGKVYLVGAGPGDPGLLTRRACELLLACDVIAFDALISPSIIALCPSEKEMISVGYRGYGSQGLGYRLHPAILNASLAGKSVARLKSGDPLIYGRLTQECEELRENGIDFEIIPGVTSALAGGAYAGIPMTDRDSSSDFVITSGHDLGGGTPSKSNWEALGKSTGTIAIYMAATKIEENCRRLIEAGRSQSTPAAFIADASRGSQRVITGTLADLGSRVGALEKGIPALIIAGEVVSLRGALSWREKLPLHHLTLLLARARPEESQTARLLRALGADVIEAPWVRAQPLADASGLDACLERLPEADRILFSCVEGVSAFFGRLLARGRDVRRLGEFKILALGLGVERKLSQLAIRADFTFKGQCDEALREGREALGTGPLWVVTSSRGRDGLMASLRGLGAAPRSVAAYEIDCRFPPIAAPVVDYVILPGSTSAEILARGPWGEALKATPALTLGSVAKAAAAREGFKEVHVTGTDRPEALVDLIRSLEGVSK